MFATMLHNLILSLIKTLIGILTFILCIPFFFVVYLWIATKRHFEIQRKNIKRENNISN